MMFCGATFLRKLNHTEVGYLHKLAVRVATARLGTGSVDQLRPR